MRKAAFFFLALLTCAAYGRDLAIIGATAYTQATPRVIRDSIIVIHDGRIAAVGRREKVHVPPGTEIIDAAGRFVVPGFWNSHVHLFKAGAPLLETQLRYGFTTIVDTGSVLADTLALRKLDGPRILTAGEPVFAPGGSPVFLKPLVMPEISEPAQAAAIVDAHRGADALKLYMVSWMNPGQPSMSLAAAKALADEAHKRGLLVLAHPQNSEGLQTALAAGADVIMHTTPDGGPWPDALLAEMLRRRVALTPTLMLWSQEMRGRPAPLADGFLNTAIEQLRAFRRGGGTVLFGTDAGYLEDLDPTEEYARMARAGMSFEEILDALTTNPARVFRSAKSGALRRGFDADVVILDADPAADAKNFASVRAVVRAGKVHHF